MSLFKRPSSHRYKTRTKTRLTGIIHITGRLIYRPFPAECRLYRHQSDTIRLGSTIATAFANSFIDKQPLIRNGHFTPTTPTAFFRRTGLIVNNHTGASNLAHLALDLIKLIPMMESGIGRPLKGFGIFLQVIRHNCNAPDPFRVNLACDDRRIQRTIYTLTTGHRDRIVVEYLVGNIDTRCNAGSDRENPGMEISTVTNILKNVLCSTKWTFPDPTGPFCPHLGKTSGVSVHPHRHEMAPYTCHRPTPIGYYRRTVVRTPGTKIRCANHP